MEDMMASSLHLCMQSVSNHVARELGREGESVVIIIPHSAASTQSRYTWTQTKGEVAPSTSQR